MKPKLSVLMANYNNASYIGEAVESVMNQTFIDWELLIVDDGSSDDSLEKIEPFLNDDRVKLIVNKSNIGFAMSLRNLVAQSKSDIFGILDSDDVLTPDAIDTIYSAHIQNQNCGFVYTQFMYCDKSLKDITIGFCKPIPPFSINLREVCASAFMTFKKKDYIKTFGYRGVVNKTHEIREAYPEDHDIVFQMEEVTKLFYVNKVCYKHRVRFDSASNNPFYKKFGHLFLIDCKYDAYLRRKQSKIPNLSKFEISSILRASLLCFSLKRYRDIDKYFTKSISVYPIVFLFVPFLLIKKIICIIRNRIFSNKSSLFTDYHQINKEIFRQLNISTLKK
jgi:glycosyltransferase involved in cell wall biosynthesis